ncbi:cytosine-5--methyltransferase [Mycena maculata]|uniref:Cytosine-5--methyltransferase n=1 Tax=Mycena maculata TaxID=230809 RepID=A0AAD7IRY3_9AGAR|nr:cytosine-5--methyltransferase [Mycena maculata]
MGRNNKRGGRKHARDNTFRADQVQVTAMHNDRLFAYYQAQKIVPSEEWESFLAALRTPLPTTFRVAGTRQTAHSLNETLRTTHVPALSNLLFDAEPIPAPLQLPWYPDGLAWQFNVSKKVLRKSPEFKEFHSFLVFETEVGNVSRQEAVSMLPPLFLDVQPHHRVLDMCAAPGSKTAQLLEALHAQDTLTSSSIPPGLLIANDSDHKRTHLLIHQSARLPSPALMVTNLDASIYPSMRVPVDDSASSSQTTPLLFDRILADVPCSGDGTLRKNVGIWAGWQAGEGNGLHGLQLRILQRAMKLLAPGGRIVYSTCSMNPVENEAVLAAALGGEKDFHLLPTSHLLPALVRRPGLTTWQASDRSGAIYESYDAFLAASEGAKREQADNGKEQGRDRKGKEPKVTLTRGHFPPPPEEVERMGLERCIRIYPHLQDTGGFFVAVLERRPSVATSATPVSREKKREADHEEEEEVPESKKPRLEEEAAERREEESTGVMKVEDPADVDTGATTTTGPASQTDTQKGAKAKKGDLGGSFKEHPYTFLPADDPTLAGCIARLHLTPSFPSSTILVRNPAGTPARALYLASPLVRSIITHNHYARIRLASAGVKVFTKQEAGRGAEAQFRVLGEALPLILPYMDEGTIVEGDLGVLRVLVQGVYPLCTVFPEPFRGLMEGRELGSHVVRFPQGALDGASLSHDVILPIWKSNVSLTLMIDKKAKSALSMRVFGKDITTPAKEKPLVLIDREDGDGEVGEGTEAERVVVSVDDVEALADEVDDVPVGDADAEMVDL